MTSSDEKASEYGNNLEFQVREKTAELIAVKARLEDEIEARKKAEGIVSARNRLLGIMSGCESRKRFLDEVVRQFREWSGCSCAGIRVLNEKGAIPYESFVGFSEEFWKSENMLLLDRDDCICTRIVSGKHLPRDSDCMTPGGSFRCNDTASFASCLSEEAGSRYRGVCIAIGFSSVAAIAIRNDERTIGLIHLADKRRRVFIDSQIEIFEACAPLLAEAIARFKTMDELLKTYETQQVIDSILRLALEEYDLQTILDRALEKVLSIPELPMESSGSIFLIEADPQVLVLKSQKGLSGEVRGACGRLPVGRCICGRAALLRKVLFVDDIGEDHDIRHEAMIPHGHYCVPMISSGKVLGVMNITVKHGHAYNKKEEEFLLAAANALAGVIERKRMEAELDLYVRKLERSNRDLEEFAFVAHHDLSEPLRKVRVFADVVFSKIGESAPEDVRDRLQRIQSATVRMERLLKDLLDYSRISTRSQHFERVDLTRVANEAASDLCISLEKSGGRVEIEEMPQIDADPTQVRQLIQNLIANAVKFCYGVPPVVHISARCENENCLIYVKDNGIGFDEEYLDRIFDPFQRLHGRAEYEGTGMGLAICRRIAERHRGSITAKSTPGKGSTFIITLPISHSPSPGDQAQNSYQYQVYRHDVVQKPGGNQNQNA